MRNNKIQQKIKLMSMPGSNQLLLDILQLHDQVHDMVHSVEYYDRLIKELRNSYKTEMITDDVVSKQRDLESLIQSISDGDDKFINKMMKDASE